MVVSDINKKVFQDTLTNSLKHRLTCINDMQVKSLSNSVTIILDISSGGLKDASKLYF